MKLKEEHNFSYSQPVFYVIKVSGTIPSSAVKILSNFYDGKPVCIEKNNSTTIEGMIKDQVALFGLMSYLSDLKLTIISVKSRE